jgi:SAM-dependent methyltransferase
MQCRGPAGEAQQPTTSHEINSTNKRDGYMQQQRQPADYVLGGTQTEQDRLLAQTTGFESEAAYLLDRLAVQPGWRAIDVGCGPLGLLPVLAERVGPSGAVVGLEREGRFVEMARAQVVERRLPNVTIVQADGRATGLPRASFDIVHERLVLINLPDPEALLAEMIALARPGGWVAAQEVDSSAWFCEPPHPAWSRLFEVFEAVFRANGLTPFFGRRLPGLLRAAGLHDVQVHLHARVDEPGDYRRTHLLSLMASVRERAVALGLLPEGELDELLTALRAHLDDPNTLVSRQLLVQAWGRRPN